MPKERDPFHKYVEYQKESLKKNEWKCLFCGNKYCGNATRIRAHLAGIPGRGIKGCENVNSLVRAEASQKNIGEVSGLDKSTGGTTGKGTEGTVFGTGQSVLPSDDASNPNDMQDSNQLGCVPQQGSLPPDDRPPANLDTSQPSSLLYLSEAPAQPDLSTHLEFEGDVLPTLLNKITPTCISPDSDGEDPGSAEQFANEVLLDSLPGTAPARPQDQESLSPGDRPRDNLDNTQQSDPSNCRSDAANGIENASSPQRCPMDLSASPYHYFTELEPLFQLPVAFEHMGIDPFVSQASDNALPSPQHLPCGTGLTGPSSLPEIDMNEGAPVTSHPNTSNNFEENRALKRKLERLYIEEAGLRDELDFAESLSLPTKLRKEVVNWLVDVKKLRNDCTQAASENCLPHQQVDILMREVEDLRRQGKGLFEAREAKVSKLLEKKMVGQAFQRNTTKILKYLVGNQVSRLGIYGMGGVGKTTIMLHIHNRLLEKANYGNVLWITVSHDFKTQGLQDAIGKILGLGILQEEDLRKRASKLHGCLTERGKSTIILDDVWEYIDLEEVGIPVGVDGIKLVLTTRSIEVCRQMQCQETIKIKPISHIEAKSLFLEIEAVVESIVQECAGLPLAVITIARSMRGVTNVFKWKDCLEKLIESDMGQTDMDKVVLKRLEFSYNCLGKHEVQQCFLSCALYPEDKLIDKFELIEFFIDQGLIGRLDTRKKQYDRGLTILDRLSNVCLLEDHGIGVKMHDLIRDMALHIMSATSIVKAKKELRTIPSEEYWTDALEKVSLMENYIEEFPSNMSPNCPKLSTFLLKTCSSCDLVIPDSFFKHLWGLKVLDLSGCSLKELPNSISDLVNLTALLLRGCDELHHIPHLGKLRSLRKLDISCCLCIGELKGLEMLVNLRYLDITCTWIETLPKGTLGALLNLQCLGAKLVNEEEVTKLWALETLICLFNDVDDFNKFVRVVSKQGNSPRYYKISVPQEGWDSVDQTNVGALFQYRKRSVDIEGRSHAIVSVRGESSGSGSGICILLPQDVWNLRAWNCDGATNLSNMGPLEELEELEIKHWSNLRVLCGGQDEEVIDIHDSPTRTSTPLLFRSLRDLEISECPKLKYLFGHEPKFSLPHLRRIRIKYCREMVGITVAATSPPSYPPLAFPGLEDIEVVRCGKMKRVVESEWLPHFPNLRRLSVFDSENMEEIIGGLSSYMLVEKISSERLLVEGCHELPLHPQNLKITQVIGYEGMAEMISGVGQGQERSMTTPINNTPSSSQSSISLPKLKFLYLRNLPQLKSICEVPITCNSMEHLEVIGCQELNKIPLELQFHDIKDLLCIVVEGEEKWKTLIWDHPDAQANLQSHLDFDGSCILEGRHNSLAAAAAAAADAAAAAIAAADAATAIAAADAAATASPYVAAAFSAYAAIAHTTSIVAVASADTTDDDDAAADADADAAAAAAAAAADAAVAADAAADAANAAAAAADATAAAAAAVAADAADAASAAADTTYAAADTADAVAALATTIANLAVFDAAAVNAIAANVTLAVRKKRGD